ncbi:unnamed protein product [Symbiodinium sp. CCMP2456]|nr:unnamed protein product [Symbiodinium sp. CCMP2456]
MVPTEGRYRLLYVKLTWVHDEANPGAGSYVVLNFTGVHHLCDGGTVLPFSEWATTCRNLCDKGRLQCSENVYTMDVTVLRGRRAQEPLPAPLAKRMFIPVEAVLGAPKPDFPTVTARVNFPNSVLEQMQKHLQHAVTKSGRALSKNDVMHAIVWHKMIEIFGPQVTHDGKHSTMFFPADMRGRYPGIGRNHIGDATSINAVEVEAETVTLKECAQKFHDEARSGASVEYFREQLDFEASRKPESRVHGFFTPAWPTLITTSVRHGPIYEGRFGGKMGSEGPINFSFVRPSLVVIPPYRRPNPTEEQKDWESGNDMQITIPLGQDETAAAKFVASLPKGTRLLSIWSIDL